MQTPYLFHDLSLLQQKKTAPNCTKLQQRTQTRAAFCKKKTSAAPSLPAELRRPPSPTSAPPASLPASPSSSAGGSSSAPPPSQPRRPSASTGLPGRPASAAICRAPAASLADERAARLSPRLAVVLRGARLPLNLAARAPSTGPPGRAAALASPAPRRRRSPASTWRRRPPDLLRALCRSGGGRRGGTEVDPNARRGKQSESGRTFAFSVA